jgi:dephospho-CoA kinase
MAHSSRHKPRRPRPHKPPRPRGPWVNGPIPVIGLTGGIGAGKSLAASSLEHLGLLVLDADAIGHALLAQSPARDRVVERFGREILMPPGAGLESPDLEIDRKALGRIVFADPSARRDLEAILHPAMRKTFERAVARSGRNSQPGVVLDAAVLYEAGWNTLCDTVVFIEAPRDQRLARLASGRGWSPEDLDIRERAQLPLAEKRVRADHVLENATDPADFQAAVAAWWSTFLPTRRTFGRTRSPHP